jgi:hypothetical protein
MSKSELKRIAMMKGGPMPVFDEIPEEAREEVEERAAIMEYEGGLPREEAEQKAVDDFKAKPFNKPNFMQGMKI